MQKTILKVSNQNPQLASATNFYIAVLKRMLKTRKSLSREIKANSKKRRCELRMYEFFVANLNKFRLNKGKISNCFVY